MKYIAFAVIIAFLIISLLSIDKNIYYKEQIGQYKIAINNLQNERLEQCPECQKVLRIEIKCNDLDFIETFTDKNTFKLDNYTK